MGIPGLTIGTRSRGLGGIPGLDLEERKPLGGIPGLELPTLSVETPIKAEAPKLQQEPRLLTSAAKSFTRGVEGMLGTVGGGVELLGDVLEWSSPEVLRSASRGISAVGKNFRKFWENQQRTGWEAPDPAVYGGSFMENPSWKRAIASTTGALPTLLTTWGIYKAVAGKLIAGGLALKAAQSRAGWAAVSTLGFGLGTPATYVEAKEAGVPFGKAVGLGLARGVGETILEVLPLMHFIKGAPAGIKRGIVGPGIKFGFKAPSKVAIAASKARYIFTGAAQEGAEEGLQEIWTNILAKLGYDKTRSLMEGVVESVIAGAGSGGVLGSFTAGTGVNLDKLAEEANIRQEQWDLILGDVAGQIRLNSDAVEGKLRSLGAAARGFSEGKDIEFKLNKKRRTVEAIDTPYEIRKVKGEWQVFNNETLVGLPVTFDKLHGAKAFVRDVLRKGEGPAVEGEIGEQKPTGLLPEDRRLEYIKELEKKFDIAFEYWAEEDLDLTEKYVNLREAGQSANEAWKQSQEPTRREERVKAKKPVKSTKTAGVSNIFLDNLNRYAELNDRDGVEAVLRGEKVKADDLQRAYFKRFGREFALPKVEQIRTDQLNTVHDFSLAVKESDNVEELNKLIKRAEDVLSDKASTEKLRKVKRSIRSKVRRLQAPYKNIRSQAIEMGGIDPDSITKAGYSVDETFKQFGLLNVLKKGGNKLDGLATELGFENADAFITALQEGAKVVGNEIVEIEKEAEARALVEETARIEQASRSLDELLSQFYGEDLKTAIKKIEDMQYKGLSRREEKSARSMVFRHKQRLWAQNKKIKAERMQQRIFWNKYAQDMMKAIPQLDRTQLITRIKEAESDIDRAGNKPWKQRGLRRLLTAYNEGLKKRIKTHSSTGRKFSEIVKSVVDGIKGRKLDTSKYPKWIKEAWAMGERYFYGGQRGLRLFNIIDGYTDGLATKYLYDRANDAVNDQQKDFNENWVEALDAIRGITKSPADQLQSWMGSYWYKESLELTNVHINGEAGKSLKIDPDFKVWLFAVSQDADGRRHLLGNEKYGGFTYEIGVKEQIHVRMTESAMSQISQSITPQEIEIYKWFRNWYDSRHVDLAKSYLETEGKTLGFVLNYMSLRTEDIVDTSLELINIEASLRKGITKERDEDAMRTLKGQGFLKAFMDYLHTSSRLIHMGPAFKDIGGVINSENFQKAVRRHNGDHVLRNTKKWFRDMQDRGNKKEFDILTHWMDTLRFNTGVAVLGWNILATFRQSFSSFNAVAEIGSARAVMSAWMQVVQDPQAVQDFVYARSPQIRFRSMEREYREMAKRRGREYVFSGESSWGEKAFAPLRYVDKYTMLAIWKAAYDVEMKKSGSESNAIFEAERVALKTQPQAHQKDLPAFFRGSGFSRWLTMFQNQVNQNFGYWTIDVFGKYKHGRISRDEMAWKVLWSMIMPAMLMGIINRGGLPDEPEDVVKDLVTYPAASLYAFGTLINGIVRRYEQILPLPLQQSEALWRAVNAKSPEQAWTYGARALTRLLGVPGVAQYERTYRGIADMVEGHTTDVRRLIWSEWQLSGGEKPRRRSARSTSRSEKVR